MPPASRPVERKRAGKPTAGTASLLRAGARGNRRYTWSAGTFATPSGVAASGSAGRCSSASSTQAGRCSSSARSIGRRLRTCLAARGHQCQNNPLVALRDSHQMIATPYVTASARVLPGQSPSLTVTDRSVPSLAPDPVDNARVDAARHGADPGWDPNVRPGVGPRLRVLAGGGAWRRPVARIRRLRCRERAGRGRGWPQSRR